MFIIFYQKRFFYLLSFLVIGAACGCTPKKAVDLSQMSQADLIRRGQSIYQSNCISCHNMDPSQNGGVGPAVSGSSLELIEARLLRSAYPPGYKPKRSTGQMPQFLPLKNEIPALHAYLSSIK